MDLIMLVNSPRRRERTLKEYRDLLAMAGFRLGRIDPRSATPVFRDVAYCVDQAHRTVLGETAGAIGYRSWTRSWTRI